MLQWLKVIETGDMAGQMVLLCRVGERGTPFQPAEVGYRQSYRGMQRSPPGPRSCNVIGRRANEWAEGKRRRDLPNMTKLEPTTHLTSPRCSLSFGQSTASQLNSFLIVTSKHEHRHELNLVSACRGRSPHLLKLNAFAAAAAAAAPPFAPPPVDAVGVAPLLLPSWFAGGD